MAVFWLIVGGLTAAAAALDARAIAALARARLLPDAQSLAAARAADARATRIDLARAASADPILERNPFDHETRLGPPAGGGAGLDPGGDLPCGGVRVAAIAASSDPEWSFAAIQPEGAPRATLARRGDEVGGRRVALVAWDRVWLTRPDGSELCRAELFARPAPPPPRPSAAAPTVVGAAVPEAIARGIKKLGPNEYEIDRATRDRILETQQDLMGTTRVSPETVDGRVLGVRLSFKPDSLLALLGLANGDRLETINGMGLSSPESALQAFARTREAERLTLKVVRGGQPLTIDYAIK